MPAAWVDEVFEEHRQRQYPRELMFSTIVELMTLVTLGLRPSLHAAARKLESLPVSVAALYDKLKRTEPQVLQGLVRGSAQRLVPVAAQLDDGHASLPGWQLRIVDGNHLPASEKRLQALRGHRGAALPGHSLVVYDPDAGLVRDLVACEDAHESERVGVQPLVEGAQPGQLWIADRHFCTHAITQGFNQAGASFIVREHARHPRLIRQGRWGEHVRIDTGRLREQAIEVQGLHDAAAQAELSLWRRIEIELDTPTEAGETVIRLWTNLPATVDAAAVAALYRKRWRIEGMFQRLESVLHSEIKSLGHPRAALLGFTYHLAEHVKSGYEGMLIAVPAGHWPSAAGQTAQALANTLLRLACRIVPRQVSTSKRAPKLDTPKGYVDASIARSHVSTARVLRKARAARP